VISTSKQEVQEVNGAVENCAKTGHKSPIPWSIEIIEEFVGPPKPKRFFSNGVTTPESGVSLVCVGPGESILID
jgi:hypothetical protein